MLLSAGLLAQPAFDFSNRLTSAKHVDGMLARIADVVEGRLSKQAIVPDVGPRFATSMRLTYRVRSGRRPAAVASYASCLLIIH
jgi:hypothetical protein